ncbi:ATP-binding cassette sub-family C member 4 [Diabrotica virgifera virgifera]|uniref:Multidrug resistance-associated protein 4-like n=1 Tax=Diabrotica virgifera virgifera TaxID=50390 RepID=A0A6P7F6X1_DIAVI|nr:ATP-binding cassette sub-family C member 4 [Diabrotica virgifera virgifera]KAI2473995.1 ATP binding cassette (ABC) transporter subfamily C member [Diabrotica virgifera virgifera]
MDSSKRNAKETNPRTKASIFRLLTFFYNYPLFKKARKKGLDDSDIYEIPKWLASEQLGNNLEDAWMRQRKKKGEDASLVRCLISCFGMQYLILGLIQLVVKTVLVFIQPRALSKVVAYYAPNQTDVTTKDLYIYASLVVGLNVFSVIYNHNYQQFTTEVGIRVRTSVAALVYRKAVKLGPNAWNHVTVGKIVTLITKDVFAFEMALIFVNDMWIGVIQTIIITGVIFNRIQWSVFGGIGFYMLTIPLQLFVGKVVSSKRVQSAKRTDERLQLTTETIRNIKTIKMYTWENFFTTKLNELRKLELQNLSPVFYLKSLVLIVGSTATSLSFFFMIMTYIWSGHFTDAETVYFIQTCYQSLKSFITVSIPIGIAQCSDLRASLKRLSHFLKLEEVVDRRSQTISPRVYMRHVSAKVGEKTILNDISFSAEKGVNLITGNIGSGKSSIIKVLLGEYPVSSGQMAIDGTISYASEEPWLFPSTLRQNILFGEPYNEKRYNEVLKLCALNIDLKKLPKGDKTIVGDRGVNFSKGQQSRINLARAIYRISDIYLIDECLAGLDSKVNYYIFRNCIMDFLKDKVVIMVSNNINHIKLLYGNNTLVVEDGRTLSLEKQKETLDKRITYFIDDVEMNYFDDDIDVTDEDILEDEANERTQLIGGDKNENKNLYDEEKKSGTVSLKVYLRYYKYAGGIIMLVILAIIFIAAQAALSYSEKLVSKWVNLEPSITNLTLSNQTDTEEYINIINKRDNYLVMYTFLTVVMVVLTFTRIYMNFFFAIRASRNLHRKMLKSVINAFMSFFDKHFVGNVVNRFSKDLMTMDEVIPLNTYEIFRQTLGLLGILYLIISVNKLFIIPSIFLFVKLYFIQKFYLPTGRGIKRLDAATRSPMIGYLNATLEGITAVRAFEKQPLLISEFDQHLDHYTSTSYMMACAIRFYGFIMDMVSTTFFAAIVIKFVCFKTDAQAGDVGLAITQAMLLTGFLQYVIRQYTEIENNMTGIERVLEYTDIESEDKLQGRTLKNWPSFGEIKYENVSLVYNSSEQRVLKNISFTIKSKEKIGIVGRTGAGKSSIISVLFRLYNIKGRILIDNEDIKNLCLKYLRSSIGIIPQDPILFSGSIRANMDPSGTHTDAEIWSAIEKVHLKNLFTCLDDVIVENGSRYSSGQRQLICLARALVSKNKIIVLDEATSNMDPDTCSLLQRTIKTHFSQCTVLTIAHKLNTVLDCDRIMVVDHGEIIEFDTPQALRTKQGGIFNKMIEHSGIQD